MHTVNLHERGAQPSHSLMVILPSRGDFDRLQDRVISALREKGIGWIWIAWSCRVHCFYFTYLTCDSRVVAVSRAVVVGRLTSIARGRFGVNLPTLPQARARSVRGCARRFQQEFFARPRWDECRRTSSRTDRLPHLATDKGQALRCSWSPGQ